LDSRQTTEPERLRHWHDQRRCALRLGAALMLAPLLSACQEPVAPLRLGSIVFPGYEFLFLAREQGWLDERQVRLIELLSNTDALRALAAGQLEAALLTLDEMLSARADGLDLKALLILDVSDGADVVLARPPLTLRDLPGRRVAAEDSAGGAIMLGALLAAAGRHIDEVRKVSYTLDRSVEFYTQRQADFLVTAEPWAGQLEQLGARRIFDSRSIPGRIVDVLAVRAEAIRPHAAALRQVVSANFRAQAYWRQQPEAAARQMAPRLQLGPSEVARAFKGLSLPGVQDNRAWMRRGGRLERTLQDLQAAMQRDALLGQRMAASDIADASFLPD
jgi:NitT/TauT family transport system substrate-binding protein